MSSSHEGKLEHAHHLIDAAAEAGADAVKFQLYRPEDLTANRADWQIVGGAWDGTSLWELYTQAQTPAEWMPELFQHAREVKLIPFASAFAPWAVEALEAVECPAYKVASLEIGELDLIRCMAGTGKPIIISTGRATHKQILAAHIAATKNAEDVAPFLNRDVALLHCLAAYPASVKSMNLRTLKKLREFGCVVGLSDHSRSPLVAELAVALGASILEVHLMLPTPPSVNPLDKGHSLDPNEFKEMVLSVRMAELALGEAQLGVRPGEEATDPFIRRLTYRTDLPAGHTLTVEDCKTLRAPVGLTVDAAPWGRILVRDVRSTDPVQAEDFA